MQLPPPGQYAIAVLFIFKESANIAEYEFERMAMNYNLKVRNAGFFSKHHMTFFVQMFLKTKVVNWRTVPVNSSAIGETARTREPTIKQAFVVEANGSSTNPSVSHLNFSQRVK